MEDDKDLYMIYSPHGHAPKQTYEYFNEVMTDAKKLSDNHPGEVFRVMQAINVIGVAKEEVIEVGDEIQLTCPIGGEYLAGTVCDVEKVEEAGRLLVKPRHSIFIDEDEYKLIRKGPKVHTFEGVMFKHYLANDIMVATGSHGIPPEGLTELADNGENYTITAEEVSDE